MGLQVEYQVQIRQEHVGQNLHKNYNKLAVFIQSTNVTLKIQLIHSLAQQ